MSKIIISVWAEGETHFSFAINTRNVRRKSTYSDTKVFFTISHIYCYVCVCMYRCERIFINVRELNKSYWNKKESTVFRKSRHINTRKWTPHKTGRKRKKEKKKTKNHRWRKQWNPFVVTSLIISLKGFIPSWWLFLREKPLKFVFGFAHYQHVPPCPNFVMISLFC